MRALRCESRGVGHPPNFVRASIEGEHKFGGWISQRWVPSSAVAGIDGRANIPRKCKIARKCDPSVWIGRERVATVQKSRGGSSSKLCQSVYRRRTQVWRMDLSEVGAEFGSCGHRWQGKHTEEMQNRPEVRSLGMDRAREGSYGGEVEGWVILQTLSDLL